MVSACLRLRLVLLVACAVVALVVLGREVFSRPQLNWRPGQLQDEPPHEVSSRPQSSAPPQRLRPQPSAPPQQLGTLPLKEAVPLLAKEGELCITMVGPWMGRLSNIVSMMNTVARHAVQGGASFRFPSTYPSMHGDYDFMKDNGFLDIFGEEPVCPKRKVSTLAATCATRNQGDPPSMRGRCLVEGMPVILDAEKWPRIESTLCQCRRILVVNCTDIIWDHEYRGTDAFLREKYWKAHARQWPATVAVHVRLGDVEKNCSKRYDDYNCNKKLKADLYCLTLDALFQVLPAKCVHTSLVTDGSLDSPDVLHVTQHLKDAGVHAPQIWTAAQLSSAKSFHLMAQANVLVYGSSGFGQLAAIVSRSETARLGAPLPKMFPQDPMSFRANSTQLFLRDNVTTAAKRISENPAIQALIAECRRGSR